MRTLGRAFEFQRRIQDWKNELFLGRFVLPLKEQNRKETRAKLKKKFYLISVWSTLLVPKSSSVKHLVNYRSDFEAAVAC